MSLSPRRISIALGLIGLSLTMLAPASATQPKPAPSAAPTKPAEPEIAVPPGFETWREGFLRKAPANGISRQVAEEALRGVTPDPKVLKRNAYQPEFTRPIWEYLDGAVSATRVKNGRQNLSQHAALLARVERAYGVPTQVIVAIWGLETSYGAIKGNYDIIRSLATLAYSGRRARFGERELINALKIIQAGDKTRAGLKGSWAGAMGHTQFLPSSFLSYAVDFDGDGRRDIWDSLPDAFASTANFLKQANWDTEYRWGREVILPERFDYALAGLSVRKDLSSWARMGVRRPGGAALPAADLNASIVVPAGHEGPAFIVYQNFRAIMRYNPATAYALGIAHLSDRIKGAGPFKGSWPRNTKILSRDERKELQTLLNRAGYGVGDVDGVIGARTRAAIRKFQATRGLPADGFATLALLDTMRDAGR